MAGKPNPPKIYASEPIGRPSKFTPERCAAIIDDIFHRIPYEMAAEANGICLDTLYEWLKIGKQHRMKGIDSDYTIFSEALKKAERDRVREHSDKIASNVDRWQSDAWLLERRWYKHYGPNAQINEMNQKLDKLIDGKHENENEDERESGSKEDDKEV